MARMAIIRQWRLYQRDCHSVIVILVGYEEDSCTAGKDLAVETLGSVTAICTDKMVPHRRTYEGHTMGFSVKDMAWNILSLNTPEGPWRWLYGI